MRQIRAVALVAGALLAAAPAFAGSKGSGGRRFEYKSKSEEARKQLFELQDRIENFQFGAENVERAKKIVALDPTFAMGQYYLSAVTPGPDGEKEYMKALELAKTAPEGDRRIDRGAVPRAREPGRRLQEVDRAGREARQGLSRRALGPHHPRPAPERRRAGRKGAPRVREGAGDRPAERPGRGLPRRRRPAEGAVRQGARHLSRRREEPAQGRRPLRHPLRRHLQPPVRGQRGRRPRLAAHLPRRVPRGRAWTSSSPRSSSGTRWRASTWRTAASTRP